MRIKPKYIQLVSEALIPLLGFFLWEWSLYFILLFYFIDLFIDEVIMHVKSKKIESFHFNKLYKKQWVLFGILSSVLLFTVVALIQIALFYIS